MALITALRAACLFLSVIALIIFIIIAGEMAIIIGLQIGEGVRKELRKGKNSEDLEKYRKL